MAVLDAELRAAGQSFAGLPRRDARPHAVGGVGSASTPSIDELLAAGRRLPRRRLRADQAEDQARLGHRAGAEAVRETVRRRSRCRSTPTPPTPAGDAAHLRPARRVRPAADRAAAARGRPAAARRAGEAIAHADLPRRVDHVGCTRAADAIALGAAEIINIKAGRVGGYLTARRIHDLCRAQRHPGVVRRDAGDRHRAGPPTPRSPRWPGSRCPATSRRPPVLGHATLTEPIVVVDGHVAVPTGAGVRGRARPGRARRGHGVDGRRLTCPRLSYIPPPCHTPSCPTSGWPRRRPSASSYAGQTAKVTQVLKMNQVITGVPFGEGTVRELHRHVVRRRRDGARAASRTPTSPSRPTTRRPRRSSSSRTRRPGCRRSWPARSRVQGDMMKLMAMQTAMPHRRGVPADRRGDQGDHGLIATRPAHGPGRSA